MPYHSSRPPILWNCTQHMWNPRSDRTNKYEPSEPLRHVTFLEFIWLSAATRQCAEDNRLSCLVQFSTCGIGSKNSSLLPSQCFSCCSLRAPSLKSRKYQATNLSGLEAVNSPCLSYFPNQVFPIKTGPYLPLTATWTS